MRRVRIVHGDITRLEVDAVVTPANERMLGGGGVDGTIHRAAGPRLLQACRKIPEVRPGIRCPTGSARMTEGFDLKAKHIIHAVGPLWNVGADGEEQLLASCYRESLRLAEQADLGTVAFPPISCGVNRFPPERAAAIAVTEIRQHLERATAPREVLLVAFQERMTEILAQALERYSTI